MNKHPEYKKYLGIAITLVSVGILIFTMFAIPPLYKAYSLSLDEEHCGPFVRCLEITFLYQQPLQSGEIIHIEGNMTFKSTFLFAVENPIRYDFVFKSNFPELIKDVNFIITSESEEYSNVYEKDPQEMIDDAKEHQRLIVLQKTSDDKFTRKALWLHPVQEKIAFIGIVVDHNDKAHFIDKSYVPIDLEPVKEYFSVLETFNSRVNDQVVLGLTWAGISAIFLLLGGDIMFRIHLRESKVDKWFADKSNFD